MYLPQCTGNMGDTCGSTSGFCMGGAGCSCIGGALGSLCLGTVLGGIFSLVAIVWCFLRCLCCAFCPCNRHNNTNTNTTNVHVQSNYQPLPSQQPATSYRASPHQTVAAAQTSGGKKFCASCGATLNPGTAFCSACGAKVEFTGR